MFSTLVVGYLFCGGAGAGACVLLAVLGLLAPRDAVSAAGAAAGRPRASRVFRAPAAYRGLMMPAFALALLVLAAGSLMLVADLGVSERAQLVFLLPTPSLLTFGSYSLAACMAAALALACAWGVPALRWRFAGVRALHGIALAAGSCVAVYTGVLLSSMPAVPFWASAWLPVLFTVSALSCGCALVTACACFSGAFGTFRAAVRRVQRLDAVLLGAEALALAALVASALFNPYEVARDQALSLVFGPYALLFLGGAAGVGILLPAAVEAGGAVLRRESAAGALVCSACVLAGAFVLRYCIVAVGAHPDVWTVIP